jgi:hypothetical protein
MLHLTSTYNYGDIFDQMLSQRSSQNGQMSIKMAMPHNQIDHIEWIGFNQINHHDLTFSQMNHYDLALSQMNMVHLMT